MKKRLKMILTASMLAFCLALMGFGVYAASSHTLNVSNYISFDIGDNIAFSIEGYRTSPTGAIGSRTQSIDSYYNQTSKQGGSAYEVGMADNDGTLIGWNISTPIVKLYAGETMTWTFTVINKGGNPIYINMINATNPWGENATLTSNSNVLAPTDSTPTTFTVTFKVADAPTFNADTESEALSFNIKLDKNMAEVPAEPTWDKLSFTLVDNSYYVVKAKNYDVTGEIVLPNAYEDLPLKEIGKSAFSELNITDLDLSNCTNLEKINMGAFGINQIKILDFSKCVNLKTIEDMAFCGATNIIESINFSNCVSLETIGLESFSSRSDKLTTIDLSSCINLKEIRDYAFYCNNLTTIYLPKSQEGKITFGSNWKPNTATVIYK